MQIVHAADRRVTTTPNATMTTLASPTLGGTASSLWLVEMPPNQEGPAHTFAGEILWAITSGSGEIRVDGARHALTAGDTVVIPAGELRQFVAGPAGFSGVVTVSDGEAFLADGSSAGVPPWVA